MVRNHGPEDIFPALASAERLRGDYARRTGDYQGASKYRLMADYLDGFDKFVENYDPTQE